MLIVDDILFSPIKGVHWLAKRLGEAASEEIEKESERITAALSELYMMLETGRITEEEFDNQEKVFLDRLDTLRDQDE